MISHDNTDENNSEINPNDSISNITNSTTRLSTSSALKSFFDKPPKGFNYKTQKLQCKICLQMVKGNLTINTNLASHAKNKHPDIWEAAMNGIVFLLLGVGEYK